MDPRRLPGRDAKSMRECPKRCCMGTSTPAAPWPTATMMRSLPHVRSAGVRADLWRSHQYKGRARRIRSERDAECDSVPRVPTTPGAQPIQKHGGAQVDSLIESLFSNDRATPDFFERDDAQPRGTPSSLNSASKASRISPDRISPPYRDSGISSAKTRSPLDPCSKLTIQRHGAIARRRVRWP